MVAATVNQNMVHTRTKTFTVYGLQTFLTFVIDNVILIINSPKINLEKHFC